MLHFLSIQAMSHPKLMDEINEILRLEPDAPKMPPPTLKPDAKTQKMAAQIMPQ